VLPVIQYRLTLAFSVAARMESTGFPDCIQISQNTADLLISAGKQSWIKARADMVNAKGKGLMQTYILEMRKSSASSSNGGSSVADSSIPKNSLEEQNDLRVTDLPDLCSPVSITSKKARLVDWIVELLIPFIKEIAVRRSRAKSSKTKSVDEPIFHTESNASVLGEVKEIVTLPSIINSDSAKGAINAEVEIDPAVGEQLRHYLSKISLMYPENPCKFFQTKIIQILENLPQTKC
jgi:hypothetical protein